MPLSKSESRQRFSQLNALMCDWDPIRVMSLTWARDEYHCLVGPLMTMLESGATQHEIAAYLEQEIVEHFGCSPCNPELHDFVGTAARVRAWFDRAWRDVLDPVTIFVALTNYGIDLWRPVQARPLGDNVFRIVGVEADVSDETWQFPAGAIVRCEPRRRSGEQIEMVAVEYAK